MNFKHFLEMVDVLERPTTDIHFTPTDRGYYYNFTVPNPTDPEDELNYKFTLHKSDPWEIIQQYKGKIPREVIKDLWKNVWYLELYGPSDYNLINMFKGGGGVNIYSKILLAIKKLTEIENVEGLEFTPWDNNGAMALLYDRFIRQFSDFKVVNSARGIYLKDELIQKIKEVIPDFFESIEDEQKAHADKIAKFRKEKYFKHNSKRFIGKMIAYIKTFQNEPKVGIVYGTDGTYLDVYYLTKHNTIDTDWVDFSKAKYITTDYEKHEANKFIDFIQNNKDSYNRMAIANIKKLGFTGQYFNDQF